MTMVGYSCRDLEQELPKLLEAMGYEDYSLPACKVWAREFIQETYPWWPTVRKLKLEEAQAVGRRFQELLCEFALATPDGPRRYL